MKTTIKWSVNPKLNRVLSEIENDLEEMGMNEVIRYYREFKSLKDYNIVMYGNLLLYYEDVRMMYKRAGYKSIDRMSNTRVWEIYKSQVGYVVRMMVKNMK